MLYELIENEQTLKPVPFAQLSQSEKRLETLIADHLFDVLFQMTPLLPFYRESPYQAVGDIYALNDRGDIVIFELKLGQADPGALEQLLRYAGAAGLWSYTEIERIYKKYSGNISSVTLADAHAQYFNLDTKLRNDQFNRNQRLLVVGNAAADQLIRRVEFWREKGLSIDFLPYRIYDLDQKMYFEFFAKPYDQHVNPASRKGVFFNTNRSYDYEENGCIRDMLKKGRVAAYGDRRDAVLCVQTGDYIFYSHNGTGIVGAGMVKGHAVQKVTHDHYEDEWYRDVELLTPIPSDFSHIPRMTFGEVTKLLGHGFYWARTDVRPYLSVDESKLVLEELRKILGPKETLGLDQN